MEKLEIEIPFCGFYNSEAESMIDSEIEQSFDIPGTGNPEIPEDFYDKMSYKKIFIAFCKHYTECFEEWLNRELDIDITLTFKDMQSPREYNFSTDRIFCEISEKDIKKLWEIVDVQKLAEVVKNRCTSYDGFCSFYPNTLDKGEWLRPLLKWDYNQLQILLEACFESAGVENMDFWDIMEDSNCNGEMDSVIWDNVPPECLQMIDDYSREQEAKENQLTLKGV